MRTMVMEGPDWSPSRLLGLGVSMDMQPSLKQSAATQEEGELLPVDWAALQQGCGLQSFMAVPICAGGAVLGMLTVAGEDPHALQERWGQWQWILIWEMK